MDFEWDDKKAEQNLRKHNVRFTEAATTWLDSNAIEIPDPKHADNEDRWIRLGVSNQLRVLVVVYVEKVEDQLCRIISARKADSSEQAQYLKEFSSYEE